MSSDILIWNAKTDFIKISEGTGDNLLEEDVQLGYQDYIMIDFLEYNGCELIETDGAQIMLYELYQEKFTDAYQVIQHLIDTGFIPNETYTVLFER